MFFKCFLTSTIFILQLTVVVSSNVNNMADISTLQKKVFHFILYFIRKIILIEIIDRVSQFFDVKSNMNISRGLIHIIQCIENFLNVLLETFLCIFTCLILNQNDNNF